MRLAEWRMNETLEDLDDRDLNDLYMACGCDEHPREVPRGWRRWQIRKERRQARGLVLAEAAAQYSKLHGLSAFAPGDFGEGTFWDRLLDFWQELIESGRLRDFMEWLFENLPKLIAAIVSLFT